MNEKLEAVERAAAKAAVSLGERDHAIQEARAAGASLRAIAKATGAIAKDAKLSHEQVRRIVSR